MNRDKYLENIEIKNRRLLLKIYKKHIEKLKIQIFEATEKGNSTVYLENLRSQVEKQIAQFEKDLKQYSASAVKTSYESGAKTAVVGELAKEIAGDYVFGTANNEAMRTLAQITYEPLSKMAQQIGRATREYMKRENFQDTQTVLKALGKFVDSNYLRKVGIEGVGNVVVGSETWQTAARKIRDKMLSEANIKVPYYNKKGDVIRFVHAQDYAKMVSRTTTANVFREGAKDRILDTFGDDGDLVEIIGKSIFPDSPCIPYQGKILSLEGQTKGYTTIKEAKANGLFHPNCIHNFAVTDKVMAIYNGEDYKQEKAKKEKVEFDKTPETKDNTLFDDKKIFVPAKDIAEAKAFAEANGVKYAMYENMSLEYANEINKALLTIPINFRPAVIMDMNKAVKTELIHKSRASKAKRAYGVCQQVYGYENKLTSNIEERNKLMYRYAVAYNSNKYKTFKKLQEAKTENNKLYKEKFGYRYNFNLDGKATIYHEMAHCYANNYEIPKGFEPLANKWYQETKIKQIEKVSEAWAEAFAGYHIDNPELPDYIKNYMKGLKL